ncbi:GAD-like domain protein OS=Tsukamurella paurometabola (strain ATCC 8368 / DSM / CCUG 35730 /CIP 100753 / JCM 10117 / KCTC 9821 / NBRC 16120 / NCIMB 702349/ NCTC 13040) OX=521096 GN=Tpau_0236 PE=4 SV=1 [Tsukamurella paurometabola]|uniref:GAD-like domain protein n=1 Tax=Tsukamurella paurometabola (strain ATCC 8368 / DSM 20162 / CCUG 35730 / CIP 100753 / JCM 10117 / KCTC 9821 / NBRC 16120 / NCIMB 702349 / NCTC 13040) TaxID=521096 RepID=D5UQQ3_TSUPD|nr:GAD-like domain-containing protein [Tsukamurella paurometabola]ADG76886.1 GAD-like domain protein [Tsukamurella paurometabola DSM 20162]SUP42076.1 GAD-like domain [Tsukamurella paurometabola]
MTDDHFELFLRDVPLTTAGPACTQQHLDTYRGVLPNPLLSYWQEYGFSGFGDGIVWLTDPLEWQATTTLITAGITHRPLGTDATYIPILRTAFGKIWFWTPGFGRSLTITPAVGTASCIIQSAPRDLSLQATFATGDRERYDFDPKGFPGGLFEQVLTRCGPLTVDQVYHFTPSIVSDDDPVDISTAQVANIHEWLAAVKTEVGDWSTFYI